MYFCMFRLITNLIFILSLSTSIYSATDSTICNDLSKSYKKLNEDWAKLFKWKFNIKKGDLLISFNLNNDGMAENIHSLETNNSKNIIFIFSESAH